VKWLKLVLKFSFSFLIIGYMIYSDRLDMQIVKQGFTQADVVLGGLFLIILGMLVTFYRWLLLLRGQNLNFTYGQACRYGLIGAFFNTTMPGAVSGDIIKAWYVLADHKGQSKTPVLTSILLDRILGVFGLVTVSTLALLGNWNAIWSTPALKGIAFFVLALAAGVFFFFTYIMLSVWGPFAYLRKRMDSLERWKVGALIIKVYDTWMHYRNFPGILFQAMMCAVFTHLCAVGAVMLCAHALGETQIALYHFMLIVPLGLLTTAVPVAPAGLGVGHVAFGSLFQLAGSNHGAEIFTLFVTMQILVNLSGVFFYLKSPKPVPVDGAVAAE
jgi:glycosyltransferase 2 family protein